MIKVKRNLNSEKITKAIDILNTEKAKKNGEYNKEEVLDALKLVFSNKCYICENKKATSYNIEHFRPHKNNNIDLKFDWNNLFLACAHCNNIKSDNYENILNCTEVDVDEVISFRKSGNFVWNEKIEIEALAQSEEINKTVELLNKVYEGNTPQKSLESINIKKELREELSKFNKAINEYYESDDIEKEDAKYLIIKELKSSSPFAAFKRWIVRDNKEVLGEFLEEDNIKVKGI